MTAAEKVPRDREPSGDDAEREEVMMIPDGQARLPNTFSLYGRAFSAAVLGGAVVGGLIGLILAEGNGAVAVVTTSYGVIIGLMTGLISVSVASLVATFLFRLSWSRFLQGGLVSVIAGITAATVVAGAIFSLPPNSGSLENLIWITLLISTIFAGVVYLTLLRACDHRQLIRGFVAAAKH